MCQKKHGTKSSIFQKVCIYIQGYFAVSTIHGFNHIANKKHHILEKVFWIILVAAAIYGGSVLSNITLDRYYTNPVVISIERDRFSWATLLPALTICPRQSINEAALDEYLDTRLSQNKTFLREFLISLFYANYTNFERVPKSDEISPEDYMSVLQKIKSNFTFDFTGFDQEIDSKKWIFEIITEMGLCYSFNSPLAVYSSYKYWKSDKKKSIVPEIKVLEAHPLDGKVAIYMFNIFTDFMVYFHGPYEVVDIGSKSMYKPKGFRLYIVTALSTISSESIKQLSVRQRKCRFYYENNLQRFPIYTSIICRIECRISLAKKLCGCVPHFYRRTVAERTCNITGLHCLAKHKDRLLLLKNECNCIANCEEVKYFVQEATTLPLYEEGPVLQYTINKFPDMRLRRDVLFGFSDMIVYIGGVMGLFLGFSLLSSMEFLYFFTLRFFWFLINNTKYRKRHNPRSK